MSAVVAISKKGFAEQTARGFKTKIRGKFFHGFVVHSQSKFFAYQNLCQHLSVTLDMNDEQFFTHDLKHLQCHLHGAIYEIDTGKCIAGPCVGASLVQLTIQEEPTRILIQVPEDLAQD